MQLLQLDDYTLLRMQVAWHELDEPDIEVNHTLGFDYRIMPHRTEPNRFALRLRVTIRSGEGEDRQGYEIDSVIMGSFLCPADWDAVQSRQQVRSNGSLLLYGTLRGHVSSLTANFPGGKFVLPTVSIPQMLAQVDERKSKLKPPIPKSAKRKRAEAEKAKTPKRTSAPINIAKKAGTKNGK